ncbi:hypothetical protein SacxiDRAFT_1797 [Saccharomonospora xinjiangensis XJ-54]|uniref:Uncharacterized protein n=1 Tax=Saccharomonospora xinjiangensis XJ-54 TaxID=882086 RepID=I0V1N6_9PSEU|nr:hypothetical protein SacxiDRAFT_1797 [Saccharomonospora xinjiangensis XJ-54]
MGATGSPATSSAYARLAAERISPLHRVLLVVALAFGGWLFSALIAGTATADEEPPAVENAREMWDCSEASGAVGSERPMLGKSHAAPGPGFCPTSSGASPHGTGESQTTSSPEHAGSPEHTVPTEHEDSEGPVPDSGTDSADPTDPTDSHDAENTECSRGSGSNRDGSTDSTDSTDSVSNTGGTEPTDGTGDTGSTDRTSDVPGEDAATAPEKPVAAPEAGLLEPVEPLLDATTNRLLSTTSGLLDNTRSLTGLLFDALPEVTGPIGDTIEDVVDAPGTLPGDDSPLDLLPGITIPRLPIGIGELLPVNPGERPALPDGDARVGPVASPGTSPETSETSETRKPKEEHTALLAAGETEPVWDTSHGSGWTTQDIDNDTEAKGRGSSRPFGPVAPSPSAPASFATPSSAGASSQDNSHHPHRGEHGILSDVPTVTQLRLLGNSRDHDVVGAGRAAALPTTSPD